jgi:hypothetical protein
VRTVFLWQNLSDPEMRKQITEMTNKVEAYNGFAGFLHGSRLYPFRVIRGQFSVFHGNPKTKIAD